MDAQGGDLSNESAAIAGIGDWVMQKSHAALSGPSTNLQMLQRSNSDSLP